MSSPEPAADPQPDHVRRCFMTAVARLLERRSPAEGWGHVAVVEPGARYELATSRDGHGLVLRLWSPAWQPAVERDSPGPQFTGFLVKVAGFALGGLGAALLAWRAPGPAPLGQLALFGAFFGAMVGWGVSLVLVSVLSARNPTTQDELEAVRAETAALLAGPTPPEVDLLAEVTRRFSIAQARHRGWPRGPVEGAQSPAAARAALQELWELSVLARTLAPLWGEAREAEVAALEARRERARESGGG